MRYLATYGTAVPLACAITVMELVRFCQGVRVRTRQRESLVQHLSRFARAQGHSTARQIRGLSDAINARIERRSSLDAPESSSTTVMRLIRSDLSKKWGPNASDCEDRYSLKGQIENVRVATPRVARVGRSGREQRPHRLGRDRVESAHDRDAYETRRACRLLEGWRPTGPTFRRSRVRELHRFGDRVPVADELSRQRVSKESSRRSRSFQGHRRAREDGARFRRSRRCRANLVRFGGMMQRAGGGSRGSFPSSELEAERRYRRCRCRGALDF